MGKNAVNIFAQILIMKIMLTDIHGIFPHNDTHIINKDN